MVIWSLNATRPIAALLLLASPAVAESLDLPAAMARARERAGAVEVASERAAAARYRRDEARATRWPRLRIAEILSRTDVPAEVFAFKLNQERFSFPDFVAGDPNQPAPLTAAITRLEVEVPVYTGGELGARIRQAGLAAEGAQQDRAFAEERAAAAAATAYVQLEEAREQVALLERSRGSVAAHRDLARAYAEQGLIVASEVLRAEVELARMEDLLAAARGLERVAEAGLAFQLGDGADAHYELLPLAGLPADPGPLADLLAAAAARADLTAARRRLEAGELEAGAQRARSRPSVGLLARQDWVDDRPLGSHGSSSSITALATWELWDGGRRRAAVAAAERDAAAGRAALALVEAGVRLEVRRAFEELASARARHATAVAAVAAAAESARIVEERFRAGVQKTLDVLDAATAAREAEARELASRAEAHLATAALALAAGRRPESLLISENRPAEEDRP